MWLNLLLFCIASVGMTKIVVDGSIFAPIREWISRKNQYLGNMLGCHMCAGFWCGMFMGVLLVSYKPNFVFACGCAASFLSLFSNYLITYIEAKTIIDLGPESPPSDEEPYDW